MAYFEILIIWMGFFCLFVCLVGLFVCFLFVCLFVFWGVPWKYPKATGYIGLDHLVGLVVRVSASRAEDCTGIFPGSSHTSDLKTGITVATLPGDWCHRVSAGTGWPGVSIL